MPILHIRNVPDELYERLRRRAVAQHRSLSAEVIELLEAGVRAIPTPEEFDDWLERARKLREELRIEGFSFDTTAALREDRER
jgi:plasmid stability protein